MAHPVGIFCTHSEMPVFNHLPHTKVQTYSFLFLSTGAGVGHGRPGALPEIHGGTLLPQRARGGFCVRRHQNGFLSQPADVDRGECLITVPDNYQLYRKLKKNKKKVFASSFLCYDNVSFYWQQVKMVFSQFKIELESNSNPYGEQP